MGKKIEILPTDKADNKRKTLFRTRDVWKKFCLEFKVLKNYTCEICGKDLHPIVKKKTGEVKEKQIHVHHRTNFKTMGGYMNLNPENFMLLCPPCHTWAHKISNSPNFKDREWWIKEK